MVVLLTIIEVQKMLVLNKSFVCGNDFKEPSARREERGGQGWSTGGPTGPGRDPEASVPPGGGDATGQSF